MNPRKRAAGALGAFALVGGGVIAGSPPEQPPPTGAWVRRLGFDTRTARVGRNEIRYVRAGSGPALVLIHGVASSSYSWADVASKLAARFDVIALDLPGFGGSSQPADLSFEELPGAVTGLLDTLGVPRAHFAGNSLGGAVAAVVAMRDPERVLTLTLVDSAGFNMAMADRPVMIRALGSEAVGQIAEALPIRRALTGATLRHLMKNKEAVTDERVDEYVAPLLRPGALASTRALLSSEPGFDFERGLSAIQAPTLVVWGRYDPWIPEEHADRFVAAVRGARKAVVEAGHMPQEEIPADIAALLVDHLARAGVTE